MESRMIKATFLIVLPLFSIFTYAGHNKMNQDSLWQMIKEMKSVWGKQVEDVSKLFNQPLINNTVMWMFVYGEMVITAYLWFLS